LSECEAPLIADAPTHLLYQQFAINKVACWLRRREAFVKQNVVTLRNEFDIEDKWDCRLTGYSLFGFQTQLPTGMILLTSGHSEFSKRIFNIAIKQKDARHLIFPFNNSPSFGNLDAFLSVSYLGDQNFPLDVSEENDGQKGSRYS